MSRKVINGIIRESTDVRINGISDFFAPEGDIVVNGQEHYDFFRRYGVSATSLLLWLDQSAITAGISVATWSDLSGLVNDMKQATASYQPSLSNTFRENAARDVDGVDNFMQQEEFEDETGATFWPTNAGGIFAATKAAFRVAGVDLSPFASAANDYMLVIHDSADKTAWGYIDLADSAEALGGEELADSSLNVLAAWNSGDANITHDEVAGTATWDGAGDGSFSTTAGAGQFTVGALYKIVVVIDSISAGSTWILGSSGAFQNVNNPQWATPGTKTAYVVCTYDLDFRLYGNSTCNAVVSNISVKEVTHVGADGVLIMSTKGGSTQSWALQETGIDLNDIDSFEVLKTTNQITAALSVFMWVKPDDGQPAAQQVVLSKWRTALGFRGWAISIMVGAIAGKIQIDFSSDGDTNNETERTNAAFFSDGQEIWHHIGFVYNGTTCVIYGDGVALASTTGAGHIPAALYDVSEKLTIGALSTPGSYFAGLIGPTVVASRAYSATEASRLFNADRARFGV